MGSFKQNAKEENTYIYRYAVFIGRFQPFHVGHLHNIKQGLLLSKKVIILIGSAFRPPNIINPFSYKQRRCMIISDLNSVGINLDRIIIEPINDWFYNEKQWYREVEVKVKLHARKEDNIAILGHQKDSSSYYLKRFPHWKYIGVTSFNGLNATDFRMNFFKGSIIKLSYLVMNDSADGTIKTLKNYMKTKGYRELCEEFKQIDSFHYINSLHNSILITTDALLFSKKHILLVKRKNYPSKGLWALPGGFLKKYERISDSMRRNLIKRVGLTFKNNHPFSAVEIFDYPYRSPYGRLITHLGLIILPEEKNFLIDPLNHNGDVVEWFKLDTILNEMSSKLADDYYQIINFMISKYHLND